MRRRTLPVLLLRLGHVADLCDACGAERVTCELDRRTPGWWGGGYVEVNCHYLCKSCHSKKSAVEYRWSRLIPDAFGGDEFRRWHQLAFPPKRTSRDSLLYFQLCQDAQIFGMKWRERIEAA